MNLDHLLPISDPDTAFFPERGQVWFALHLRITDPCRFLPGLSGCDSAQQADGVIRRELDFGGHTVVDEVSSNQAEGWIRFAVRPTANYAGGSLTIRLEDMPSSGSRETLLGLRFTYRTTLAGDAIADGVQASEYVKAAYIASDRDTVRIIREILVAAETNQSA